MEHKPVIIVGAGPVGLLIALRLAQAGIPNLVLERHHELLRATRACVYQPIVIQVLRSLGLLDLFLANAFASHNAIAWRDMSGTSLGELAMVNDEYTLLIGQWRMNCLLLDELAKYPCAEVRFSHQVVGIEQDEGKSEVRIMVHRTIGDTVPDDDVTFSADWVIGTDGANSSVRKALCIPFEGFTFHEFRMVGVDVLYDFVAEQDWEPVNFIVHPETWAVVVHTGENEHGRSTGDGRPLWRVAYGESMELDGRREAVWERAQTWVKEYTGGRSDFQITRAEPYILQQRCAQQGKKNRVMLAGDALHSNNPMGGLGLTGGILDAYVYGNALVRVLRDGEPDALLAECAEARRQAWLQATGPTAVANLDRLRSEADETVSARETFFERLRSDEGFPKAARAASDEMMKCDFQAPMTVA